jgi:hypothetical protein
MILSATKAQLSGMCSSKTYTGSFIADVEDNSDPGKGADKFTITYDNTTEGVRSRVETSRSTRSVQRGE